MEYIQYHLLIVFMVTLQACTVKSMLMTAIPHLTLPLEAPSASTMAPVWTRWVAIAAPAHQASSGNGARATSMSVSPTPVTHEVPRTACSVLMTSTASAGLATLVRALGWWVDGQCQQSWILTIPSHRTPLRVSHQWLQGQTMQEWGCLCCGLQHCPWIHLQVSCGRCPWLCAVVRVSSLRVPGPTDSSLGWICPTPTLTLSRSALRPLAEARDQVPYFPMSTPPSHS